MKTLLTCNLSDNTVANGDETWQPPVLTYGETFTLALRFARTVDGNTIEPNLTINSLQCSLGYVDARPLRHEWALQIGAGAQTADNTTAEVGYAATAAELQAAIAAKAPVVTAYGAPTVKYRDGSWWITFATATEAVPLQVRDNSLFPLSFGQCDAVEIDGVWHHEVRLIQLPVDATTTSAAILPPAPTVSRIQAGGSSGEIEWNEIQRLYVRPDFRATYYLKKGYARTRHLSRDDGPEEVLAALVAALGDNFAATLAADFRIDIEFTGDYAGDGQDLLEVVAIDPPPGDLTFSLPLNRAALRTWLRASETVTLPLEVKLQVEEDGVEATIVPVRTEVTIRRPLNWAELEEEPNVDWLRPPSPKNYKLFNPDTVITGQQFYPAVVGDGVAVEFEVTHGLSTTVVRVWVTENAADGLQLIEGTDYEVRITSEDLVTVTALGTAPAEDAWLIVVMSAQTVAAFAAGLEIEIAQVTGLAAALEALENRVEDLETLLPTGTLVRAEPTAAPEEIEIPDNLVIFPNARIPATVDPAGLLDATMQARAVWPGADAEGNQIRPPGLLPAIHDATVTEFSDGELPSPTTGNVYKNTGADAVLVPGGLGRRGRYLKANEFAGYDGRVWYHVTRGAADSTSFFPTDFEQELVPPITFELDTWRAGQVFRLEFDLALLLVRAATNAQWVLVVEHGTVPSDTSPATTTMNLQDVVWNATPVLAQRLTVSALKQTRHFGVRILRSTENVMSAEVLKSRAWSAADSAPATAQFALRVRMIRFDTENSVTGAVGYALAALSEGEASIS